MTCRHAVLILTIENSKWLTMRSKWPPYRYKHKHIIYLTFFSRQFHIKFTIYFLHPFVFKICKFRILSKFSPHLLCSNMQIKDPDKNFPNTPCSLENFRPITTHLLPYWLIFFPPFLIGLSLANFIFMHQASIRSPVAYPRS